MRAGFAALVGGESASRRGNRIHRRAAEEQGVGPRAPAVVGQEGKVGILAGDVVRCRPVDRRPGGLLNE